MSTSIDDIQNSAEKIARSAGDLLLTMHKQKRTQDYKEGRDFATDADYASEKLIIDAIKNSYPDHDILSEENGEDFTHDSEWVWTIDPLDGTRSYKYKLGFIGYWAVNITIEHEGKPIVGVMYKPEEDKMLSAQAGKGFKTQNHSKIGVSEVSELDVAFVSMRDVKKDVDSAYLSQYLNLHNALIHQVYRLWGSHEMPPSAYHVMTGYADAYIIPSKMDTSFEVKWWDIGPSTIMVQEAGGTVTDFSGKEVNRDNLHNGILMSNGLLHEDILRIIANTM